MLKDIVQKFNLFYKGVAEITHFDVDDENSHYTFYIKRPNGREYWEPGSEEAIDFDRYVYSIYRQKITNQNNIYAQYLENIIAERM